MAGNAVAIAAIVMLGLLLIAIAWQLLAGARTAVGHRGDERPRQLADRIEALERLHDVGDPLNHQAAHPA